MAAITVTKQTLQKMLIDSRHLELLPPLQALKAKQQAAPTAKGCRPCAARRRSPGLSDADLDAGLRQLANYLSDKPHVVVRVTQLLGASELRIKYRKGTGEGYVVRKF
jgi:hypothetical protein